MSQRTINVGQPPGNLGDGDTLRDAFEKTNKNFSELYNVYPVIDTSLEHDDPTVDGTIAKALLDAGDGGGGVVLVGPGTFVCPNSTLTVPENVILRGSGRIATTIKVTGGHDGITLSSWFTGVESLMLWLPDSGSGDGIRIRSNYTHLRDLLFIGCSASSWGINVDRSNVCKIDHVAMGTIGPYNFLGNGILFQNTDPGGFPFNYGDSLLIKVDVTLARSNTTALKFHGPDGSNNVINNVLLSQVEVLVENGASGCTGLHLRNAKRITCTHVDLENLETAILEESGGGGNNVSSNNVFISTFVFGSTTSYRSSGVVNRRLFLGCDNLTPDNLSDTDVLLPRSLWLSDDNCRIQGPAKGQLTIDDGNDINGVRFIVDSESPSIVPESPSGTASLTLGRPTSLGVQCIPGIVLPTQNTPITGALDGTIAQFNAGVVGANRGLYQLRDGAWVFIG